jgi:hypothetical protein
MALIVNLNAYPSIRNLLTVYFKKERAINVFAPKKDWRSLEKNNSPKGRCRDMMDDVAHFLKRRFPKWNLPASGPSSDFASEQDRSSSKTSSMER